MATVKRTGRKVFCVFMSMALASLMVPLAPRQAIAEGDAWALVSSDDATGLATEIVYNQHNPDDNVAISQTIKKDGIATLLAGDPDSYLKPVTVSSVSEVDGLQGDADGKALAYAAEQASEVVGAKADQVASERVSATDLKAAAERWVEENAETLSASDFVKNAIAEAADVPVGSLKNITARDGSTVITEGTEVVKATGAVVTPDTVKLKSSPTVDLGDLSYAAADGSWLEEFTKVEPTSGTPLTVSGFSPGGLTYSIKAEGATSGEGGGVELSYSYIPKIAGYTYGYHDNYSFDFSFSGFTYSGWTFAESFDYKYAPATPGTKPTPDDSGVKSGAPAAPKVDAGGVTKATYGNVDGAIAVQGSAPDGFKLEAKAADGSVLDSLSPLAAGYYLLRYVVDEDESDEEKLDAAKEKGPSKTTVVEVGYQEIDGGDPVTVDFSADADHASPTAEGTCEETGTVSAESLSFEGRDSGGVDFSAPSAEGSIDVNLRIVNLFDDSKLDEFESNQIVHDKLVSKPLVFEGNAAVAGTAFAEGEWGFALRDHALAQLGSPKIDYDNAQYYTISYDVGSSNLSVKPKHSTVDTNGEVQTKDATLTWTLKDGTAVKQKVRVNVEPKELSFDLGDQDFRLRSENEGRILEDANSKVDAAVGKASKDLPNYYSSVSFGVDNDDYYDKSSAARNLKVSCAYDGCRYKPGFGDDKGYADYRIIDPETVKVNGVQSEDWENVDLKLSSANGDGTVVLTGKEHGTWVKEVPTAVWENHSLAYVVRGGGVPRSEGDFVESPKLTGGDGIHSVGMYAIDDDQVISRVKGVSYKLDQNAPQLDSAKVSSGKSANVSDLFVGRDYVDVEFVVTDHFPGIDSDAHDSITAGTSGVVTDKTAARYDDAENGKKDVAATLERKDAPIYSFRIDGSADVPTSSIEIEAVDKAGNEMKTTADKNNGIDPSIVRLVSDADNPQISVTFDVNDVRHGRYFQKNRNGTITINEAYYNYVKEYNNVLDQTIATVYKNGEVQFVITPETEGWTERQKNVWTFDIPFNEDADWEIRGIQVTDLIGRTATAPDQAFTIDTQTPKMEIEFDNNNAVNGNYYNAQRVATITLTEHNFDTGLVNVNPTSEPGNGDTVGAADVASWQNDGDVHTTTVTFPGEGVYSLSVTGVDSADNPLPELPVEEFIVDTVQPEISIDGVANQTAYAEGATPSVTVKDTNVDESSTVEIEKMGFPLTGDTDNPYGEGNRSESATEIAYSYSDAAAIIQNDGVYTINVQATDKAGNTSSQAVVWSVNRFGSTYVIDESVKPMLDDYYVQPESVDDVKVMEINPSGQGGEGSSVELFKDTGNKTLALGSDYDMTSSTNGGWQQYSYTVKKQNFTASEENYSVLFHSMDTAGNVSENTMSGKGEDRDSGAPVKFAVDGTPPTCTFIGIPGTAVDAVEYEASVKIEDNMKFDTARVMSNGQQIATITSDQVGSDHTATFNVPSKDSAQDLSIVALDAAGNESAENAPGATATITVSTNMLTLWLANTPLFVGSVIGVIAVVGAGAFLLIRRRRVL